MTAVSAPVDIRKRTAMMSSTTESTRYAHFFTAPRPSRLGTWLGRMLARLGAPRAAVRPARDRVREAAELREWAATLQRSDPRFADDLFAAADRHEREAP